MQIWRSDIYMKKTKFTRYKHHSKEAVVCLLSLLLSSAVLIPQAYGMIGDNHCWEGGCPETIAQTTQKTSRWVNSAQLHHRIHEKQNLYRLILELTGAEVNEAPVLSPSCDREAPLSRQAILSGEGIGSLSKNLHGQWVARPLDSLQGQAEEFRSYRISQEMARLLLKRDFFGRVMDKNPKGSHVVQCLTQPSGCVFFKSDTTSMGLPVGREASVYWFAEALFGENMAPTSLLVLNDVEIGDLSPASDLYSLYNELCVYPAPNDPKKLTAAQFMKQYPACQKDITIRTTSHVLQSSLGITGIGLDDFILGCASGKYSFNDLDQNSFGEQIILSLLLTPTDSKADNFMVRTDLGTPYPIVGIDNDMALNESGVVRRKLKGNTFYNINVKTVLYCFNEFMNQIIQNVAPRLITTLCTLDPKLILLKWLGAVHWQEKQYEDLKNHTYDGHKGGKQLCLSDDQYGQLALPLLFNSGLIEEHLEIFADLKAFLKDHKETATYWDLFCKVHPLAGRGYKKLTALVFELQTTGLDHPLFRGKPLFKKVYQELMSNIEHCNPASPNFNPILATYRFVVSCSDTDLATILDTELQVQTSKGTRIKDALGDVETTYTDALQDLKRKPNDVSKSTVEELILHLLTKIDLSVQPSVVPFVDIGIAYFKSILHGIMQKDGSFDTPAVLTITTTTTTTTTTTVLPSSTPLLPHHPSWCDPEVLLRLMQEGASESSISALLTWGWDPTVCDPYSGYNLFHYWVLGEYSPELLDKILETSLKFTTNDLKTAVTSPLDLAMEKGNEAAFIHLIRHHLTQCTSGKALSFYRQINTRLPSVELQEAFTMLMHQTPELQWEVCKQHMLPKTVQGPGYPLQTSSLGTVILPQEVMNQLIDPNTGQRKCVLNKQGQKIGNHDVACATYQTPFKQHQLYFKFLPDLPGIEEAVGRLTRKLLGFGAPYTDLIRLGEIPVMVSEGVQGPTLLSVLRESTAENRHILANLDLESVSGLLLVSMLINPEDGKPENYIVEPHPTKRDKYRIIGVDNDHAFVPSVAREDADNNALLKVGEVKVSVQVKSIIYCLNQMKDFIPDTVVTAFLRLNPFDIIMEWLEDLRVIEKSHLALFKDKVQRNGFFEKSEDCYLKVPFPYTAIRHLYEKFIHLQDILERNPKISPITLLEKLDRPLAKRYHPALQGIESIYDRFKTIDGPFYLMQTDGSSKTMTKSGRIVETFLPLKQNFFEKIFDREVNGIEEALEELRKSQKDLEDQSLSSFLAKLTKETRNPQPLTKADLEREHKRKTILKRADFANPSYTLTEQKALLTYLQRYHRLLDLTLQNCTALTKPYLDKLHFQELRSLDLRGCNNISNACLITIATQASHLQTLTLAGIPTLPGIGQKNGFGFLNGEPLEFRELTFINLANCRNLKDVYLKAPKLLTLDITNCALMTDEMLDGVIEHSERLEKLVFEGCPLIGEQDLRYLGPPYLASHWQNFKGIKPILKLLRNPGLELKFEKNEIDTSPQGLQALGKALQINKALFNLTVLDLWHNNIGDAGAKAIAQGNLSNLTELNLWTNNIGDVGAQSLAQGSLLSLRILCLIDNNIGEVGSRALVEGNLTNLTSLYLQDNKIGAAGASFGARQFF